MTKVAFDRAIWSEDGVQAQLEGCRKRMKLEEKMIEMEDQRIRRAEEREE